jgi:hydroxyacylglutathione hydrolase
MTPSVIDYPHGISAIDSGYVRPQLDAIHIVVEEGRVAVVDSGTNDSVPLVLAALADKGLGADAIDFVMLTHVHLDHAGGAGLLMTKAPNAKLVVHPRGARHMIDPSKLMAATRDVYGVEAATRMYGEIVPVPKARVIEATDGSTVDLAGRTFTFHDTPGHAKHHNCIHDGATGHLFTGDMFGLSYRELDRDGRQFVFPATTPTQFDPEAFHRSIERMTALRPDALYLTHYGQVVDVPRIASDLLRLVDAHAEVARRCAAIADPRERVAALQAGIRTIAEDEGRRQHWGVAGPAIDDILGMDIQLNADGLESWIASGAALGRDAAAG